MKRLILAAALFASPATAEEVPSWVKQIVTKAVTEDLKDPESAKFRWLPYQAGSSYYCGLVNARNSYGGYVGFKPFMTVIPKEPTPSSVALLFAIGSGAPRDVDTIVIIETCTKEGYNLDGPYTE